jgi:hypothetical protein
VTIRQKSHHLPTSANQPSEVSTDADGRYQLPVYADVNLMVIQPSGWQVPVDRRMVPQFFYVHKENGSPAPLRFGGLPATGPMPKVVNFPLRKTNATASFRAALALRTLVIRPTALCPCSFADRNDSPNR